MQVPHNYIQQFTPESDEVTNRLAASCAKILNAKVAVAATGLTTWSHY